LSRGMTVYQIISLFLALVLVATVAFVGIE
jgi:hypothetical protein